MMSQKRTLVTLKTAIAGMKANNPKSLPSREVTLTNVYRVNQVLIETMKSLERPLLVVEDYEARLKIGHYLAIFASENRDKEKAYIDFLGWTYCLLGDYASAKSYIEKGITLIDRDLANDAIDNKGQITYDKVRALRHLGSDEIESAKHPDVCLKYLNEACALTGSAHYLHYINESEDKKQRCLEMQSGLDYGFALAHFNRYLLLLKEGGFSQEALGELVFLKNALTSNLEIASTFKNHHRYLKWLILENRLRNAVYMKRSHFTEAMAAEVNEKVLSPLSSNKGHMSETDYFADYKATLGQIASLLESSVYNDEVMIEFFVEKKEALALALDDVYGVRS
jgi:tetratricopeptide (TPR) repeat protein